MIFSYQATLIKHFPKLKLSLVIYYTSKHEILIATLQPISSVLTKNQLKLRMTQHVGDNGRILKRGYLNNGSFVFFKLSQWNVERNKFLGMLSSKSKYELRLETVNFRLHFKVIIRHSTLHAVYIQSKVRLAKTLYSITGNERLLKVQ